MKKLLLLSVLLILMAGFTSLCWATMMNEGFESGTFPPAEWTTAGIAWQPYTTYAHTGLACTKSGYSPDGDWWLITPALQPAAGANTLSFWYRDYSSSTGWDYNDEFTNVMVSTSSAYTSFSTILWTGDYTTFTTDWQQAVIDLSAYEGQNIYIAFKSNHTGGNYRMIDDVTGINFAPSTIPPSTSNLISPLMDTSFASILPTFSWTAAAGNPDGYKVYLGTTNPPTTLVSNQTGTSWTPGSNLLPNTEYWWQVVPFNANGDAIGAPVWHFTTGNGLTVTMTDGSLTLPVGGVANFFDSGGELANYVDYENYIFTFHAPAGYHIVADFTAYNTEGGYDYLRVYNGPAISSPEIGVYNGPDALLGVLEAAGDMTFYFTSDGSVTYFGWVATITTAPNADFPAGVDTPLGGITLNPTIDLTIDPAVTTTDPVLVALPTYNPATSTAVGINGTGVGDITVTVPAGTWYLGIYNGTWTWSVPNPFVGPGSYTFVGVDFGAKADVILLLTPDNPTLPVELSSFTATLTAQNYVNLAWITQSETEVQGFNVYRSDSDDVSAAVRINASMVPATNTSTEHSYSLVDNEVTAGNMYYYWLENVDLSGVSTMHGPQSVTVIGNPVPVFPEVSLLNSAYPNPFRSGSETTINVSLKQGENGTVTIYNILGQTVKTYKVSQGTHTLKWDGKGCGSGVYFYRLTTPTVSSTRKLVVVK